MKSQTIYDPEAGGFYNIFSQDDFEFVDPIKHYRNLTIETSAQINFQMISMQKSIPLRTSEDISIALKVSYKEAEKDWTERYEKLSAIEVPSELFELLSVQKKKKQISLLKKIQFAPDLLIAFIFRAYTDFRFTLSQYIGEHYPKGTEQSQLPKLAEIVDGKVKMIGDTSLSEGQVKHAINFRNRTIAKFLDRNDNWHCFFTNYKSLKGKESWKEGQPHYHYISDKFGISRDKVIKELKSRNYKLGSLPHIDLLDYKL